MALSHDDITVNVILVIIIIIIGGRKPRGNWLTYDHLDNVHFVRGGPLVYLLVPQRSQVVFCQSATSIRPIEADWGGGSMQTTLLV